MVGALPLPDNEPTDKYIYEILVSTGDKNTAMTDSQVSFMLSGERSDTGTRTFGKSSKQRPIFRRGALDTFVMTTSA
ncbi:unnamed protein product [Cyprideis torosa]|uniref:Uncharacterized protein n=1 Tax=Cyprideis torosa TaxID=163714 RepID=A0A7R8WZD5_9CRUS|nr:unnamed protein product [Cyprideis torosa]CAG0910212.1 unnamed protein product [Cyprideis torosa]